MVIFDNNQVTMHFSDLSTFRLAAICMEKLFSALALIRISLITVTTRLPAKDISGECPRLEEEQCKCAREGSAETIKLVAFGKQHREEFARNVTTEE